ncbi:MAG: hypothetical protein WBW71_10805 [Bacteroidota bacterium]
MDSITNKDKSNPVSLFQKLLLGLFIGTEIFVILFVFYFWKDLQANSVNSTNNEILVAIINNTIALGFLRVLIILVVPVTLFLLASLSYRVLLSSSITLPGVKLDTMNENLEEAKEKYDATIASFKELEDENTRLKEINATLISELYKQKIAGKRSK